MEQARRPFQLLTGLFSSSCWPLREFLSQLGRHHPEIGPQFLLSDKYFFQRTFVFCLSLAFKCIDGFSQKKRKKLILCFLRMTEWEIAVSNWDHLITFCKSHISARAASSAKSVTSSEKLVKDLSALWQFFLMHAHHLQWAEYHDHYVSSLCGELHLLHPESQRKWHKFEGGGCKATAVWAAFITLKVWLLYTVRAPNPQCFLIAK